MTIVTNPIGTYVISPYMYLLDVEGETVCHPTPESATKQQVSLELEQEVPGSKPRSMLAGYANNESQVSSECEQTAR